MNRVGKSEQGFTIIELLVAMAFVSILLLGIAMTVIQISNNYNKGLTMKAVDQSGRTISADIRQTLSASQPFKPDTAFIEIPRDDQRGNGGGRLCTGRYTYAWNYGSAIADNAEVNVYDSPGDTIRFVRVLDNGGQYCAFLGKNKPMPIKKSDATELLSAGDKDLAIQSFAITQLASDSSIGQALYRIVMEIGTNNQDALQQTQSLDTIDTSCKPPSDESSLQDFCAVNQFDFTAQAGNKGGSS